MTDPRREARARLARARRLGERFVYVTGSTAVETPDAGGEPYVVAESSAATSSSLAASSGGAGPSVAASSGAGEPSAADGFDEAAWTRVRDEALACTKCDLCQTRTQVVWGSGTPRTGLMIVGEAPGFHEDQQGEAFVGRAGQLLTKILSAIGFGREEVFITNVLKCRPPDNADPLPHQVAACEPYLDAQIALIRPAVILTLGRHAARTLLREEAPMGALRGRVFEYQGVPLVATYHPAALLRNPALKRPTWEDVQLARRIYDEATGTRG